MMRYWRLSALKFVVESAQDAPPRLRVMPPALGMGAIAIWMKNALIYRPGEQRWDTDIVKNAAFWDSNDEENNGEEAEVQDMIAAGDMAPALEERGCYFVSAVEKTRGIYHLPMARTLDAATYAMIYKVNTVPELELAFMQSAIKRARQEPRSEPRRNRRKLHGPPRPRSPERDIVFGLAEAGVRVAPLAPGMPAQAIEHLPPMEGSPDGELNAVWQDFLRDILAVTPFAQGGGGSYCTLTSDERNAATEDIYCSSDLPFRAAIVKLADGNTWDTIFFDRFFPTSAEISRRPKQTQHYGACHYWTRWQVLMSKVREQDIIRAKLLREFRKLRWLPWSSSDRIWVTGSKEKGMYKKLPEGHEGPAPKLAVNQRCGIGLGQWKLKDQAEA